MAEVLVNYDTTLTTPDGRTYRPQACGRLMDGGLWEGWLEFLPVAARARRNARRQRRNNQTGPT